MASRKSNPMKTLAMLNFGKHRRLTSVLGLALDGNRLEGVVARRTNGSFQLERPFSVALSLDLLTDDAELVGREIRNHLDSAGIPPPAPRCDESASLRPMITLWVSFAARWVSFAAGPGRIAKWRRPSSHMSRPERSRHSRRLLPGK